MSFSTTGHMMRIRMFQILTIVIPLGVWWAANEFGWASVNALPWLPEVFMSLTQLLVTPAFWSALFSTITTSLVGLLLALVVGVPVGLAIGLTLGGYNATRIVVDIGRSIPYFGLVPALILLMGAGTQLVATLVFLSCVWPILVQASYGSRDIDPVMTMVSAAYRLPWWLRWRRIIFPNATPYLGTALRIAIVMAVLMAIGAETLVAAPGIGREIALAQQGGAIALMYAYVIYAGFIGLGANMLSMRVEKVFLRWRPPVER